MAEVGKQRRIWGWMMFDWASQPYSTLLLTFIFGPYFAEIVSSRLVEEGAGAGEAAAKAQAWWGYGLTVSGVLIAVLAPVLGSIADSAGRRMPWIWGFSLLYVIGAAGLWMAHPQTFDSIMLLFFFCLGLIGMEFAAIFTNAMLPSLGERSQIGAISGSGWAWGYLGGVIALALVILFFAENHNGVTFIGIEPVLGLDPAAREGTRSAGPLTAIWYAVFMIPFFLWVREPSGAVIRGAPVRRGLEDLGRTLRRLPARISLLSYLGSSMFYRDALNGMYTFGGIYAFGVLDWSIVDIGVFGIMAAITGAAFAWVGGQADRALGPKPVISTSIAVLIAVAFAVVTVSKTSVLGIGLPEGSALPDAAFYVCGGLIGAAGGALQAASRTMMVRQSNPERMTEAFGLYALAGKATAFLAPASIALASDLSGSQQVGITPLIGLFILSLFLLRWVNPDGDQRKS